MHCFKVWMSLQDLSLEVKWLDLHSKKIIRPGCGQDDMSLGETEVKLKAVQSYSNDKSLDKDIYRKG